MNFLLISIYLSFFVYRFVIFQLIPKYLLYLQLEVGTTKLLATQRCDFTPRRIQHNRFLKRKIKYYSNHDASYQKELNILSCGDVHPNPEHSHRNGASNTSNDNQPLQSRKQGATKLSVF